jgi:hypothetical protein
VKPGQDSFSDKKLDTLQRLTFDYFLKETNPQNGLVPDSTRQGSLRMSRQGLCGAFN